VIVAMILAAFFVIDWSLPVIILVAQWAHRLLFA